MQHLFIALNAKFFKGLTSLDKIPLDFKWCTLNKPFYFITIFLIAAVTLKKQHILKKGKKVKLGGKDQNVSLKHI
jgi:hypothetical protein